jgi:NAD(P)-dependent dehydrogenase (short-subunit alcohol dehydrogenase family)
MTTGPLLGSAGKLFLKLSNELVKRIATPAYSASKAALNMLTVYWAKKYEETNLIGRFRRMRQSCD